ncbi:putative pex2 / Pex12 amino terminal region [Lyophyllum shimeji]|uniref:RING-type E3 ubiquitin transferase (cysteine targeting) n=1 Tax=Lyophyllum shimeji TaxID=47721 RepID=A0A9P3PEE4_LYOSH|nr:putative pex2 / Pex12 amino terminal region [Lyophyllum shimeji]
MTRPSPWEDAWNRAQPRLAAIRDTLNTSNSADYRVIRVGQLDSELLDQELAQLLQEPLNKALSMISTSLKARFAPELALLIQLTLYKLSIWNTGASYGAKLQDLRYTLPASQQGRRLAPSGLPRRTLLLHGTLTVILPYLHTKLRSYALSSAWPDAPSSDYRRKAWDILTSLESAYTLLTLSNFVAFLWNGRFRSIADRLLNMSLVPRRRFVKREVSYEFMNRQMVWHAFTEFLLFLLPLISARSIRRRMNRIASVISPSAVLSSLGVKHTPDAKTVAGKALQKKGKYWSLPQDQCAICAENASMNLNISEPTNAFTTLTQAVVEDSAPVSETEPPAYPIYTPYLTSCGDIYCYSCIAERLMQAVDAAEDERGWTCLRCSSEVTSAERYIVEMGSDVSGSDYEFSSDISGSASMGSYSESGWSDSSVS